jgi:hypothetical protein
MADFAPAPLHSGGLLFFSCRFILAVLAEPGNQNGFVLQFAESIPNEGQSRS